MALRFNETEVEGVWLIEPDIYGDSRGHFLEVFRENEFHERGLLYRFVQDNISLSNKGILRGLHYQKPPHAQAKLVMAVSGTILDVVVDLRRNSPTFGKHVKAVLSGENRKLLYVPPGFAHGFSVLSDQATVHYKCSNYYHHPSEKGVIWNDPDLQINWQIDHPELSEKDQKLPFLEEIPEEDLF